LPTCKVGAVKGNTKDLLEPSIASVQYLTPWNRVFLVKLIAAQLVIRPLLDPKVHYRVHKNPPPLVA